MATTLPTILSHSPMHLTTMTLWSPDVGKGITLREYRDMQTTHPMDLDYAELLALLRALPVSLLLEAMNVLPATCPRCEIDLATLATSAPCTGDQCPMRDNASLGPWLGRGAVPDDNPFFALNDPAPARVYTPVWNAYTMTHSCRFCGLRALLHQQDAAGILACPPLIGAETDALPPGQSTEETP